MGTFCIDGGFDQTAGLVAGVEGDAGAVGEGGELAEPGGVGDGYGVDLDLLGSSPAGFFAPVNLVAFDDVLIGVTKFVGFGIGNEEDGATGAFAPRGLLDDLLDDQFVEFVTIAARGILGLLDEADKLVLIIGWHDALIGLAELLGIDHVAVVTKGNNTQAEVRVVLEQARYQVGHFLADGADVSGHGAGGVKCDYHIQFAYLMRGNFVECFLAGLFGFFGDNSDSRLNSGGLFGTCVIGESVRIYTSVTEKSFNRASTALYGRFA